MNKIVAAVMALGLLPLAGCAAPRDHYASGAYAGYSSGPYDAYDRDFDDGDAGYGPPGPYYGQAYGQPAYDARGGYASGYYSQSAPAYGPAYPAPAYSGQAYSRSGYSSSYYSAPPPPVRYPAPVQPSSYYSTQYSCGCAR